MSDFAFNIRAIVRDDAGGQSLFHLYITIALYMFNM